MSSHAEAPGPVDAAAAPVHYVVLDGLRGLAILLVMTYHFCLPYTGFHGHDSGWLLQLAQGGWMGVDLFFVLSGFLITGILVDTRSHPHYFRVFFGRRFLRIWPLYYASLLVLLVILPRVLPTVPDAVRSMQDKQLWFWLYGANWLFAIEGGFGKTSGGYFWSLAVEEQFYLIWPFVVHALTRRALLHLSLGLLAISCVSRIVLSQLGVGTGALYAMTLTHLDGLAVGSCIALWLRAPASWERLARLVPAAALIAAAGVAAARVADGDLFFWSRHMAMYGYTAVAVLFGAALVWVLRARAGSLRVRAFSSAFMTRCGKYSYALYVVHVPVAAIAYPLVFRVAGRFAPTLPYDAVFLAAAAASFAVSYALALLSWNVLEKRVLALKRYFPYARREPAATVLRPAAASPADSV
jgi:peptidoglycan/LPS O-acetylase OafA/YrhL